MFGKNSIVGKKYFKDVDAQQMFVTSMFMTLQGEGPYRGMPAFFIRLAKCNLACSFCFVGDTPIAMAGGTFKKIKDVKVGDRVVTWDNGVWTEGTVSNTMVSETNTILKMEFDKGKKIFCTPEHPFYVKDKGWVEAKDINEKDIVLHYPDSERMRMYNPMHRPEIAQKVSETQKGKPGYLNGAWDEPTFREQHQKRMTENNPNSNPEVAIKGFINRTDHKKTYIEEILEETVSDLPIRFVGHGDLVVDNLVPDFVVEGQNKLIEVWDDEQTEYWGRDESYRELRRQRFAKEGYDVMFLPFTKKTNREVLFQKCVEYVNNGHALISKTEITNDGNGKGSNGKAWIRLSGAKGKPTTVYNFEVEGTHNYVANGLLVHNCDTFFDDGDWLTFDQIEERIETTIDEFYKSIGMDRPKWTCHTDGIRGEFADEDIPAQKKRMVLVMTGGEPMLQDNIGPFLKRMTHIFENTQIESNGTQNTAIPASTTLVISPKCAEKKDPATGKMVATKYLTPRAEVLERADCLKFVMEATEGSPYNEVPEWAHEWANVFGKPVFVSPMNEYNDIPAMSKKQRALNNEITLEERSTVDEVISFWEPGLLNMDLNQKNHEYAAKYCVTHGFILNLQIHLYASLA